MNGLILNRSENINQQEMNFTTPDESTNSTSHSTVLLGSLTICFYIINILFGLPTNTYIIQLIIRGSGIASDFFFLNLSVCEIGMSLNSLFALLATLFSSLRTSGLALFGIFFIGRPLFESLICVERYLAVVHPVIFLKFKPLRYRVMCCAAAWLISLGSCFCSMLFKLHYKLAYKVFFSIVFFFFLSIQMFCCLAVLRALKQSGPGERASENHMKRRAFYLILIITVSMLITYSPYIILGFFAIISTSFIPALWLTGLICYVLCGFIQPVLYLKQAGKLFCFSSP